MRRLSVVVLLVGLIVGSASAAFDWDPNVVGNWGDAINWSGDIKPDGSDEIRIQYPNSVVTLNSTEVFSSVTNNRVRVYAGATMNIVSGGYLEGPGWFRVGTSEGVGTVNQTGGTLKLKKGKDTDKLGLGDQSAGVGYYTISGGTLTYDDTVSTEGQILVGARGGTGTFTVQGADPIIQMGKLYVGGDNSASKGTLEFQIGSAGVSAIQVAKSVTLDVGGATSTAALVLSLIGAPPAGSILLVDNQGTAAVGGLFDSLNGGSAAEGAAVALTYGANTYNYTLTYVGGTGNDIMLIPEPATLALLGFGGLIAAARRSRSRK